MPGAEDHPQHPSERRAALRHCCTLQAARTGTEPAPSESPRLARVLDISTGGVALHLGEPWPVAAVLTIRLHASSGEPLSPVLKIRVICASEQPNSTWILGAAFSQALSEADLRAWLA